MRSHPGGRTADISWTTSTKQSEWTGNARKFWNLKVHLWNHLRRHTSFSKATPSSLPKQHHPQGTKYSNAWDHGWHFIEVTINPIEEKKNQFQVHVYLPVLDHKQFARRESWGWDYGSIDRGFAYHSQNLELDSYHLMKHTWLHTAVILVLGRWRVEDQKLKVICYIISLRPAQDSTCDPVLQKKKKRLVETA